MNTKVCVFLILLGALIWVGGVWACFIIDPSWSDERGGTYGLAVFLTGAVPGLSGTFALVGKYA